MGAENMEGAERNSQTLTVPAFSLNGLDVSSGMNFSRSSRSRSLFKVAFPSAETVSRFKGMVLTGVNVG